MDSIFFKIHQNLWIDVILCLAVLFKGVCTEQVGFSIQKNGFQTIKASKTMTVGPWITNPSNNRGLYCFDVTFDHKNTTPIIPRSGIYFLFLKLHTVPTARYGIRIKSSLSDRTLSAWTNDNTSQSELSLSGNMKLSIGERVYVNVDVENGSVLISDQSLFSMQLLGQFGLLPSFLARSMKDERFPSNRDIQIFNWKTYHESMTGFSGAEGIFVPTASGDYICHLNLILEEAYGFVTITFENDHEEHFKLSKLFSHRMSVATIHVSRIFRLDKNEVFRPIFKAYNASFIISKTTSFSCALYNHKEKSIELFFENAAKEIRFANQEWWEVNLWQQRQNSKKFQLLESEGKVFSTSEETHILVSLCLTIVSSIDSKVVVAVIPGGVKKDDGLFTSTLHLLANVQETATLSGYIKIAERGSSFISVFIRSVKGSRLKLKQGDLRVISIEPSLSIITAPFMNSNYSLDSVAFEHNRNWRALRVDTTADEKPFTTSSSNWNVEKYYFSPKETGIYYVSANLQATLKNASIASDDVLFAKIAVTGIEASKANVLQQNFIGLNEGLNSVNLAGVYSLRSNDKVHIVYKCSNCEVTQSSGFSATWLFKQFKVEGFSTIIKKTQSISIQHSSIIGGWSRFFSNFEKTDSFSFEKGIYIAPSDGIYLVTCCIMVTNVSSDTPLKLRFKVGNSSSHAEQFYNSSRALKIKSLVTSIPVWLTKGQTFSLLLETDGSTSVNVDLMNGSSLSIVAVSDSQPSKTAGFTLSLRENLKTSNNMLLRPLLGWTDENMKGTFSKRSDAFYEFNERQGEISIKKSAVILLNVIVNIRTITKRQLTLYIKIEERDIERVLTSRSLSLPERGSEELLKISLVLYVKSKDTIRVVVGRARGPDFYEILKDTVMSAIFLSDVPAKPGLMLGVRGYSASIINERITFRFRLKNICRGCYQDNIIYDEIQGHFKIPFAGRYMVSMNLCLEAKYSFGVLSQCGIMKNNGEFLIMKNINGNSRFEISEIFSFSEPTTLAFVCQSADEIRLVDKNFISIALLQYEHPYSSSKLKRKEVATGTQSELETSVSESAQYLVAIKGLNESMSDLKLLVNAKHKYDVILDSVDSQEKSLSTLFTVVLLNKTSPLFLMWKGDSGDNDYNKTTLYKVNPSSYTINVQVSNDNVMHPSNQTSRIVQKWAKSHSFGNELAFDYKRSLFIAKQPGEYLLAVSARTSSERSVRRTLYIGIGDELEKDSFGVQLCTSKDGKSCRTSFTTTLKLQKWQSIGLYVQLRDENDTLVVLKGTRMSIIMLDDNVPTQIDHGPQFVSQPWPVYTNISSIFDWNCDAVGSEYIDYKWNWISRETKIKTIIGDGQSLRIDGKPEESGYYFCSAKMNGAVHNSRIVTLDISDTNECNPNSTEFKDRCHADAYCINTIGSYFCQCNIGYIGNGFDHCKDIDECKFNGTCHENATCHNSKGSYFCKCKVGFSGNGTHCKDIDECLGVTKCHADSNCVNTIGDYKCVCKNGYTGNGEDCKNINECNNEKYPCHRKATCTDNKGSFTCKCNDGWTGNGTICEDIDECLFTNCTGNATCHNEPGRYRCICNRGYKGDGFKHCEPLGCTPPPHCIGEYKAAWWSRSPYLANSSNQEPAGLFKDLLTQVLVDCCANCSLLSFDAPHNGSLGVEGEIEGNKTVDFGCPLYGSPDQTLFRGLPFMPVVESPGIAFFIKDQPKERSALIGSLGSTWPILAITFLLACLSGVIIWFLDTVRNPTEFPNSFIEGSWEGFWWAFITMTTVGYGDKAPRSFPARLFGIVWILVGLVIISTFTATITTMLTASSLSDETKLYGTKVGVLHNSEEYRLGVKRNAETKAYGSVAEIVTKIREGEVQGILLDTYIAGEYQDLLRDLRLQQVIDYTFSYGVVLSRDGLALRKCFSHFLESKQSQIYATISKVIKPLKTNGQQNFAAQKSANIFDADSVYFKYIIFVGLGTFALLFLIGLTWECYNTRQRKRDYTLAGATDSKVSEMMQWRVQWESGKVSHFNRNIFKSDISDLKQEIQEFADTWISRLEELEKKQEQEISDLRNQENKKSKRRHNDSRFGLIFKYFRGAAKTDKNGLRHEMTTAL